MAEISGLVGLISLAVVIWVLASIHRIKHDVWDIRLYAQRLKDLAEQAAKERAVQPRVPEK